jgi:hypothetical protein
MTQKTKKSKPKPKKPTSRAIIRKYCQTEKIGKGEFLIFGKHKYRMHKTLANHSDAECDKVLKNIKEIGFDAHVAQAKKGVAGKRPAISSTDPKPCECGCKAMTRRGSRFLPGHDMKLKSKLKKALKHSNPATRKKAQGELKSRGWA